MGIPIFQVDAFTSEPFKGNPAGVCLLREPAEADWMQKVAAEMNVAETAFPVPEAEGFRLRWFTPAVEVKLCGHATLAAAHILWEERILPREKEACFQTLSGLLTARRDGDEIELNFPSRPVRSNLPAWTDSLIGALGIKPQFIGLSAEDILIEVANEQDVRLLEPDFATLKSLPARGVIVTSRSADAHYDFVSRFFAPAVGVPEDPVTGSSHCVLTPYWAQRLGKSAMTAYQASARGGVLRVRLDNDRVRIAGRAVTVIRGELAV